ncbi:dephospho-CoA kinase [Mycoplasmatota bacterium]|nr:dephospho-CoA kinase [Mycoplasmatota bacterium]
MKKVIGLTGGVASGKSLVTKFFRLLGAEIIKADLIGHVIQQNQSTINELTKCFGSEILNIQGRIERKKLGAIVFSDNEKLTQLNAIMLPKIKKLIKQFIDRSKSNLIVIEMAILFEAGFEDICDETVVVYSDEAVQLHRLSFRKISESQARNIVKSQMDIEKKIKLANYVIRNNSNIYDLKAKVRSLYNYLVKS